MGREIPLIFSANDYFVPYLSVMLASILAHSSPEYSYRVILLHRDISEKSTVLLEKQLSEKKNFSLRLLDISQEVERYKLYTANRMFFSEEAYYRLIAPFLLPEYEKAVYMDGDMVALRDVAELFEVDLKGCLIGAVRDFCGLSDIFDPQSDRRSYMTDILGLKSCEDYYISGLLVMDLKGFRECFSLTGMMELASSQEWRFHDQDILNILSEGRTLLLDARWNVLQDYGKHKLMPAPLYREWKDSFRTPWIIHFGGDSKPWRFPRVPRARYFWCYAKQSPFYEEIKGRQKREMEENGLYRLKYYLQIPFPLGSRSRRLVKTLTRPVWLAVKDYYQTKNQT